MDNKKVSSRIPIAKEILGKMQACLWVVQRPFQKRLQRRLRYWTPSLLTAFTAKTRPREYAQEIRDKTWKKKDLLFVHENWGRNHLVKLDIHKSMGLNWMHRVLRKLVDIFARPHSIIFERPWWSEVHEDWKKKSHPSHQRGQEGSWPSLLGNSFYTSSPWRYIKAVWTQSWAVCFRGPCLSGDIGLADFQWSLPKIPILWLCVLLLCLTTKISVHFIFIL